MDSIKAFRPMFVVDGYDVSFERSETFSDGRRATYCFITVQGVPFATGVALCSASDNFDKSIGRKIALDRAAKELYSNNRDARRALWDAYFRARGKVD